MYEVLEKQGFNTATKTWKINEEDSNPQKLPISFDPWIQVSEYLALHDELNMAKKVLEMLPAIYRDNVPLDILKQRLELNAATYLATDYALNNHDLPPNIEYAKEQYEHIERFKLIEGLIKKENEQSKTPHLVDMGPGNFILPMGLDLSGCDFTYEAHGLHFVSQSLVQERLKHRFKPHTQGQPIYFVAYEIIEHLDNIEHIKTIWSRTPVTPNKVFISTPMYCFGKGGHEWRLNKHGHLTSYTPNEFKDTVSKLFYPFPYIWEHIPGAVQIMLGSLKLPT